MATKHTDTCLAKAADDEPIFVLRAQDALAADTVRYWAGRLQDAVGWPTDKSREAIALAAEMEKWPTRRVPD